MPIEPELPKEAVLHAQRDMRNIRQGRSMEEAHIAFLQRDMAALMPEPTPERGFLGRIADKIGHAWNELRIGDEHAKGMAKLGFHELTQALAAFPDSNIRPMEEPGVIGNEAMPHIQEHNHEQRPSRGQDNDRSRDR